MTPKIFLKVLSMSVVSAALVACALPAATDVPSVSSNLKVIATFSFIGAFVQNVGGDKVEVITLVGPDSDVHDFEPVPSDSGRLAEAQIIFENGLTLETWLDNLYTSAESKAMRVVVSEGITPRKGEEQGEFDPHVWQNPQNAVVMIKNIAAALVKADAANASTYAANADAYVAKLEALDKEIAAMVEQIPADERKIVTSHDALGYFAEQYGFTVVGSVIPALSTEAGDPTAQDVAKIVDAIKAEGVKAIFLESMANPKLVERVAQEAGVKVGPELFTDALGAPGSAGGTYIEALRFNAKTLVELLK